MFFTDGRIIVQGSLHSRGKRKRADYILYYKPNIPIAIIEAKTSIKGKGKLFFTIMDFRKVTNLFADPDFDGEPVQIYEPAMDESPVPPVSEDPDFTEEVEGVSDLDRPGLEPPPPNIRIHLPDPDGEPRKY